MLPREGSRCFGWAGWRGSLTLGEPGQSFSEEVRLQLRPVRRQERGPTGLWESWEKDKNKGLVLLPLL